MSPSENQPPRKPPATLQSKHSLKQVIDLRREMMAAMIKPYRNAIRVGEAFDMFVDDVYATGAPFGFGAATTVVGGAAFPDIIDPLDCLT